MDQGPFPPLLLLLHPQNLQLQFQLLDSLADGLGLEAGNNIAVLYTLLLFLFEAISVEFSVL